MEAIKTDSERLDTWNRTRTTEELAKFVSRLSQAPLTDVEL